MRRQRFLLALWLTLAAAGRTLADEGLVTAYAAILRGDFESGRSEVAKLRQGAASDPQLTRVDGWLESFHKISAERDDLRGRTLAWNVEQSHKADGEGKLFLALTFAARATEYVTDKVAFSQEAWVKALTEKALASAKELQKQARWRDALSYYAQLERIHEGDENLKALREHAAHHARLELIYADKDAVSRRTKNVDQSLLNNTVRQINKNYYREPDFKAMAEGALGNLDALTETTKLYDLFHGLANPVLREAFLKQIEQKKQEIRTKESFDYRDLLRLFKDLAVLNKETVELPEALLIVEFLEGGVQKLDDFTSVIWPADSAEFDKMMMGEFQGVGIQLGVDETSNRLKVVTPLEDSPALEKGIEAGDLIVEVDDKTTKGWTTEDAVRQITGPAGTEVKLTIFRPSSGERMLFPLTRREIHLRTVRGLDRLPDSKGLGWNYMLDRDQGISYIRLSGFNGHSQDELSKALDEAKGQGMKGLILDLRYNPGGLLDVAISTVGTFLARGEVVSTKGRKEAKQQFDVEGSAPFANLPLIVLVNEGSASASEILAGALQDHNRAVVLGERTFGKGSVQRVLPLDKNARLKLTTALYYLPSGRSPHKALGAEQWGVDPNSEVKLMPKEMRKIIERERDTSVIKVGEQPKVAIDDETKKKNLEALKDAEKAKGEDDDDAPLLSEADIAALEADPNQAPDVDAQLESALLQMRVKLAGNMPWPKNIAARTVKDQDSRP